MNNMSVNPGSIIGGLLGAAVALAVIVLFSQTANPKSFMFAGVAFVGGLMAGNVLWASAFKK